MVRALALRLAWGSLSQAAGPLAESLEKTLASSAARQAHRGIQVVDLGTGEVLYQHNPDRLFTPASNTKLFSRALRLV